MPTNFGILFLNAKIVLLSDLNLTACGENATYV